MSAVENRPSVERIVIPNVSWETYISLVDDLEASSAPRLTYDQGELEIMSPHLEHEAANRALSAVVEIALEESNIDFESAGSTTFKNEALKRGFEPDSCFYIENAALIRDRGRLDMEIDPPCDLLIEVDLPRDSSGKFPLYAALRVPEVWLYRTALEIWTLESGDYVRRTFSQAVPRLSDTLVTELLEARKDMPRPRWLRLIRTRVRALIQS